MRIKIDPLAISRYHDQRGESHGLPSHGQVVDPHAPPRSRFADMEQRPLASIATSAKNPKEREEALKVFQDRFGTSPEVWLNEDPIIQAQQEHAARRASGEIK